MPNWCSNALVAHSDCNEEQLVLESILAGNIENRTEEMTNKLVKLAFAGIGGLLYPSEDIDQELVEEIAKFNPELISDRRGSDERSRAYSDFLTLLARGNVSVSTYATIDSIYDRAGIGRIWWGDINKTARCKIKAAFNRLSFDLVGWINTVTVADWWVSANVYKNTSRPNVLDMRLLDEIPARVLVNGFNGKFLNCDSGYNYNINRYGTKWPVFEIYQNRIGNYEFSTAWSPAVPLIYLLPEFIARTLGKNIDDAMAEIDLFYYEPGCCFQGHNDESESLNTVGDEDEEVWTANFLPEVAEAFGFDSEPTESGELYAF